MGSGQSTSTPSSSNSVSNVSETVITANYTPGSGTGARKALLIGINYTGTINRLYGCINDVNNVRDYLVSLGYDNSNITMMNDNSSGELYPTKDNILTQMQNIITSLASGDSLVIYYSGHGSQITDTSGDELSGLDQVIIPINYSSAGVIKDDEIRSKLVLAASGVKIFAGYDSCNSGSVCDLRYNYFDTSYRDNPGDNSSNLVMRTNFAINSNYPETAATVISLSGSRDAELSAEFYVNGVASGALTYALLSYLKINTPRVYFADLLQGVRSRLSGWGLSQNPEIMCGRTLDETMHFSDLINV